jgi:alpha-D-xyloside xylohydrolase
MKKTRFMLFSLLLVVAFFPVLLHASTQSFKKETDGVYFYLDQGVMKIKICKDDIVEVKYTSLDSLTPKMSLAVNNDWKIVPAFEVSETTDEIIITTSILMIHVNKASNSITYTTPANEVILAEDTQNAKQVLPATIAGIATDSCSSEFLSPDGEALFGLGCHPTDPLSMNYKGRNQSMAIIYMTGAIPVLLSTRGYGLMWDNYSASNFYGAKASNTKFKYTSESGTMVDYYFFYGPEFDHIIESYREATGAAPLFPKWSFGLIQSQDRYQSQDEILSVKNNYRKNRIPVDCIVQDWFYWSPDLIGSHIMNPSRYPNPKAMVDSLHAANIHGMISIWPVFAPGSANYDQLQNAGGLTAITWKNVMSGEYDNYYDAHDSVARDIYWNQTNTQLFSRYGWDGWWVDQCEPDNGGLLDARRQAAFTIGRGIDYFNSYSLMHSTGLYKNWRHDIPNQRVFLLTRQAYAGQQRNATTLWSSDITCTFSELTIQVPQALNACLSGIPYWTSDIGGYHLNWTAPNWALAANRTLFTRWFQFGVFSPIFRIHGKGERALFSNNWDAKTKIILLNYDNLRYRLLPYIYSLAWKVTSENYTMMRALTFDFRNDVLTHSIQDQYMFGPAFLVNPVTSTATSRSVYLPSGSTWYDFWTGKKYSGGQTITASAPIETMPLYVKAGSIIPMGNFHQYATEDPGDTIEVRVYPGADGDFTIYEDENDNYNYENGHYSLIPIHYMDATGQVTIGDRIGSYNNMPVDRVFTVVVVQENHGVGVGVSPDYKCIFNYNGSEVTSVTRATPEIPKTSLDQNYPNPFNSSTKISFCIQNKSHVTLKIYDLLGQEVSTILDQEKNAGSYMVEWDGMKMPSGIYFYRLHAGDYIMTKYLVLVK